MNQCYASFQTGFPAFDESRDAFIAVVAGQDLIDVLSLEEIERFIQGIQDAGADPGHAGGLPD